MIIGALMLGYFLGFTTAALLRAASDADDEAEAYFDDDHFYKEDKR